MSFKGNPKECLGHLVRACGRDLVESLLEKFTGAAANTVQDWTRGKNLPNGENLLRLVYLFQYLGCEVETPHRPKECVKDIARLIAFRVIGFEDAMHALGYATRDTLFGVLFGRDGISEARADKMREIFNEYYILLAEEETKLSRLREKVSRSAESESGEKEISLPALDKKIEKETESAVPAKTETCSVLSTANGSGHKMIITTLAGLINLMRPLADQMLKDDFSSEEREELRRLTGGDGVFRTGNLLGRLSSETARAHAKK